MVKVLSVSIKWSELDKNGNKIIKAMDFKTQELLNNFRAKLNEQSNLWKIIGESRNVIYEDGYDCYAD
jgi:hypothetical protein